MSINWLKKDWLEELHFNLGFQLEESITCNDMAFWLGLSEWSCPQAISLLCDIEPNLLRTIERLPDYERICDSIIRIQQKRYDAVKCSSDSASPLVWLKWFDAQGLLEYASPRLHEWYENASINIPPDIDIIEKQKPKKDQQRLEIICSTAKQLGFNDLLNIPEGGKSSIKTECLKNSSLFTLSTFDHTWKRGNKLGVIRMKDKEKYF